MDFPCEYLPNTVILPSTVGFRMFMNNKNWSLLSVQSKKVCMCSSKIFRNINFILSACLFSSLSTMYSLHLFFKILIIYFFLLLYLSSYLLVFLSTCHLIYLSSYLLVFLSHLSSYLLVISSTCLLVYL